MKRFSLFVAIVVSLILLFSFNAWSDNAKVKPSPNGITLPEGYKDWRVISSSHRTDNKTMRVIVGNDLAIQSARAGKTNPWPDGAILGKLAWKEKTHPNWPAAIVPADFVQAEFMIKDAKKYAATGGWGFARWRSMDQTPTGRTPTLCKSVSPATHR